jgi:hypothetical protein
MTATLHVMRPLTSLPTPSGKHATCAWCRCEFATVVDLLDHVDARHVGDDHREHGHAAA